MMIIKIGGSLLRYAHNFMPIFREHNVLLVPGGGMFADTVRRVYSEFNLSEEAAHTMAVLAMEQYGLFLSDISGIPTIKSLHDFKETAVLLPHEMVMASPLEPSWNVSSDTIACYVTKKAGEKSFTKLTNVDGITLHGRVIDSISAGKLLNTTTCLDKSLPHYLKTWKIDCRVVNGKRENNIRKVLKGEAVGTLVTGGT